MIVLYIFLVKKQFLKNLGGTTRYFKQLMYNDWKKIKGYNKLDPKENEGQLQSTLSDFFKSQKDQGI